jgi:hypothetical protein
VADFDIGFKIAAHSSAREMCRLADVRPDTWEPISDTLQTTERLADRAFRAAVGTQPLVAYFEAYTQWKEDARWNLLAKSALLSERERLPTRTFVFVLTPEGYRQQNGTFRLAVGDEVTQQIWFQVICLWRLHPQPWWESVPGLMTLYPLCAHARPAKDAIVFAAHAINARMTDTVTRGNLLATLSIFGNLAYPDIDTKQLIGVELMRESKFLAEIEMDAELKARREDLLKTLEIRFGAEVAAQFQEPLSRITNPDKLTQLLQPAIKSRRVAGFRRALAALQT